jgi:hypothetical protein
MDVRADYNEIPVGDGYREVSPEEVVDIADEFLFQFPNPADPKGSEWGNAEGYGWSGSLASECVGNLTEKPFRFRRKVATVE